MNIKGVTKRGENTYRFTISLGSDGNGRHIRKTMTFKVPPGTAPTKAEKMVMEAYNDFRKKYKYSSDLDEHMLFKELVDIYLRDYAPNKLKPVSQFNYELDLKNHLLPVYGNRKVMSIKTSELTTFFTGLPLSPETTRKLKTVMSSVMSFGVNQGYILHNPCRGALYKEDTSTVKKIKYLTPDQCRKLMQLTSDYSVFNTVIQFLVFTGLRIGECLCLKWSNLNPEFNTLTVANTLAYAYKEKYQSSPKNNTSYRTLKLGQYSMALLARHKEEQDKLKEAAGDGWAHPDLIFTSEIGGYLDYSSINKKLQKLLVENDLPCVTVHALRHSNASLLINNGVDIKAVSSQLGHCNINITADTYGHIFDEYKARISQSLEDCLL